jgi:hypothetical protein
MNESHKTRHILHYTKWLSNPSLTASLALNPTWNEASDIKLKCFYLVSTLHKHVLKSSFKLLDYNVTNNHTLTVGTHLSLCCTEGMMCRIEDSCGAAERHTLWDRYVLPLRNNSYWRTHDVMVATRLVIFCGSPKTRCYERKEDGYRWRNPLN